MERTNCRALNRLYRYLESSGNAMLKRLLTGCAAMLVTQAALGQIVECVDAKGNKTIAQFCPPGTVRETQLSKGGTGASDPGAATDSKSSAEQEVEFKKRSLERQEAAARAEKENSESEEAQRNCYEVRAQLKQLEDGMRVSTIDPDTGERTFLEDADRPAEIERAQKAVDNWCKNR